MHSCLKDYLGVNLTQTSWQVCLRSKWPFNFLLFMVNIWKDRNLNWNAAPLGLARALAAMKPFALLHSPWHGVTFTIVLYFFAGKTGNKKVMNVVKLGGVRYARHGKSLRRLSSGVDRPRSNASQQLGTNPTSLRKVTNTKIAAQ